MRLRVPAVVARRVLRQIVRDRRTLVVIVIQPLVIMAVFGYAFGGDVAGARVAIANLDRGPLGGDVVRALDLETVRPQFYASEVAVERAIRQGEATVGVIIPLNFTRNFESTARGSDDAARLIFYKDNTNPQVTGAVAKALADALEDAIKDRYDRDAAFGLEERVIFGSEDERSLEFFVPGIAAFSILMLGSMLTVVSIVKERTQGTLPRILVSPARRGEVIVGYAGAFGLFSLMQATVVLGVATLIFRVPVRGNFLIALTAILLTGLVAMGFGILVSGLAATEFQAVQSVFFLAFPNLFLAGVFAPIEAMPGVIRPLSRAVPLTYAVDALRAVINRGAGLVDVAPQLGVLALFAAAFLGSAAFTFGRRR